MKKKVIVLSATAAIGLAAVAVIALSLLVHVDRLRPQLARAMSAALGREVAVGRISLAVFSASAVVEDLTIADDPAFSRQPFVTAREVRVGIALIPLVMSKHLQIESLRLLEPRVTLRRSANGSWNFASLGPASSPASPASGSPAPSSSTPLTLSIDRLRIVEGQIAVETPASRPRSAIYDHFAVDIRDFSSATRFPFTVGISSPGGGTVKAAGGIGPFGAAGLGSTPFEAALDATGIDLSETGLVDAAAGLGGVITVHLRMNSNGERITASGTMRAARLQLVQGATQAEAPVDVEIAADYDLATHDGVVNKGEVRVGNAAAHVSGRFNTRSSAPHLQMTVIGKGMPLTDLQPLLPAVGAALPRGVRFRSGVLDADLVARGPLDRLVIAGPVAVSDATLAGVDLGSKMRTIANLAGYHRTGETTIQTLRATLRLAPDGIAADGFECIVPALGRLDGGGTVAPNGKLDFKMVALFNRASGVVSEVSKLASFGHPDAGVPFRISGTTTSPLIVPDVGRAASAAVKDPGTVARATGFVRSLFGRK